MSERYVVKIRLRICNHSRTNQLVGTFQTELPFVPTLGTKLEFEHMEPAEIKSVIWQVEEEQFRCTIECGSTYEFDMDSDIAEMEEWCDMLSDAKKLGCEGLDKIYYGPSMSKKDLEAIEEEYNIKTDV